MKYGSARCKWKIISKCTQYEYLVKGCDNISNLEGGRQNRLFANMNTVAQAQQTQSHHKYAV